MGKRQHKKRRKQSPAELAGDYEIYRIGVLDGIRAIAIFLVAWYHIWQQSWLQPLTEHVNLDWLVRNGSILVDMMILLSGFCLFLPYARDMVYGDKTDTVSGFYVKRVARIVPSYYLSLLIVLFAFAIPLSEYGGDTGFMMKDLITHLTFTNNLFGDVNCMTHLNGVLWTVAVEMQLYLIFPLLVWLFRKCPVGTYLGMTAIGVGSAWYFSSRFYSIDQNLVVNQTLTFFSVFANGMMATSGRETQWQLDNRFLLSLVFALFVIGMILSHKYFRKILDNRVMKFLAGISFQFYICHQYIAVKLKEFRIPNWSGDELPNMTGDVKWQWQYTILCFVLSLVVAIAMTYLVELPAAKLIKKWYQKKREKKELENEKQ